MRFTLGLPVEEVINQLRDDGWLMSEEVDDTYWEVKGTKDLFIMDARAVNRYSAWIAAVMQAEELQACLGAG